MLCGVVCAFFSFVGSRTRAAVEAFLGKAAVEGQLLLFGSPRAASLGALGSVEHVALRRLNLVLESPITLIFFRKYLEREGCVAQLDFYLAVRELRKLRGVGKISQQAARLWQHLGDAVTLSPAVRGPLEASFAPDAHVVRIVALFVLFFICFFQSPHSLLS